MGYYTRYSLKTFIYNDDTKKLIDVTHPFEIGEFIRRDVDDYQEDGEDMSCEYVLEESCKWYDYNDGMIKFSEKFPNYVFLLEGEGEETDDHWYKYYMNGKVQDVTPPKADVLPFDINKLM